MNKTELINHVAIKSDLTKAETGRALDAFLETVTETLAKGEIVSLIGFGNFSVTKRAARKGRNPKTGAEMTIAASNSAKFAPGTKLKASVNH